MSALDLLPLLVGLVTYIVVFEAVTRRGHHVRVYGRYAVRCRWPFESDFKHFWCHSTPRSARRQARRLLKDNAYFEDFAVEICDRETGRVLGLDR